MGKVIGDITDSIGLTDHKGQRDAKKQAEKQSDRSYSLTKEQIAFQRDQYNDWKNIYGPLQEDLGTYFKNLTGNNLAVQHIEAIQQESQHAQANIDRSLAQRGLSNSGLGAEAFIQNQINTSNQKASIRANADQLAAQQKMGFLGLGLGQGSQMLGINAQVSNNGATNAASMSNNALNNYTNLSNMNTGIVGGIVGSAAGAVAGGGGFGSTIQNGTTAMYGGGA